MESIIKEYICTLKQVQLKHSRFKYLNELAVDQFMRKKNIRRSLEILCNKITDLYPNPNIFLKYYNPDGKLTKEDIITNDNNKKIAIEGNLSLMLNSQEFNEFVLSCLITSVETYYRVPRANFGNIANYGNNKIIEEYKSTNLFKSRLIYIILSSYLLSSSKIIDLKTRRLLGIFIIGLQISPGNVRNNFFALLEKKFVNRTTFSLLNKKFIFYVFRQFPSLFAFHFMSYLKYNFNWAKIDKIVSGG